jgi:Mg-chelatase subunit ChlD
MLGVDIEIEEFALAFIRRLRNDSRVHTKPSLRQGIGLMQLLYSRFFRLQKLSIADLVHAAYATTYYEDQPVAKEIALEIINSELNTKIVGEKGLLSVSTLRKLLEINTVMKDYLKDDKILQEMLKTDIDKLEQLPNLSDIVFETKGEDIRPKDLKLFDAMGRLEDYLKKIKDLPTQILAENLLGKSTWKDKLKQLFQESPTKFAETLSNLAKQETSHKELKAQLDENINQVKDFDEYHQVIEKSQIYTPPPEHVMETIRPQEFSSAMKIAREIDKNLRSDLTSELLKTANDRNIEIDMEDVLKSFQPGDAWQNAFEKAVENAVEGQNFQKMADLSQEMITHREDFSHPQYQQALQEGLKQIADELIQNSQDADTLADQLGFFGNNNISFDKDAANEKGQQLNLSAEQMENLIQRDMQTLSNNIARGSNDFQQYYSLLRDLPLDGARRGELVRQGLKSRLPSLLGALAHLDPEGVSNFLAADGDMDELEQLVEGMAAGPGLNLITQWYRTNDKLPSKVVPYLKSLTRNTLVEMAIQFAKQHFGFIKHGSLLQSSQLRYYIEGDSIDQIEIDETIYNLIDQGKPPEKLTAGDLISKKEKGKTVKLMLAIDCSGSMAGSKYLAAAMASTILLYLIKPEDLAVLTFESNAYIVKSFEDPTDLDKIAEDLLTIKASGGTQIGASFDYLLESVEKWEMGQPVFVFYFSDFEFYEADSELRSVLQKLQKYNIKLVLFSTQSPNYHKMAMIESFIPLKHVSIPKAEEMPELLAQILRGLI